MKYFGTSYCALKCPRAWSHFGNGKAQGTILCTSTGKCFFAEPYKCSLSYQKHCLLLDLRVENFVDVKVVKRSESDVINVKGMFYCRYGFVLKIEPKETMQ